MGFNVGGFLKSVVSTVAPAIFKAVAPMVSEKLASIADSFIGGAGGALKGLVGNLPGPLGKLAQGLIDKGVGAAQDFVSPQSIQALLAKLTGMPQAIPGAPAGTTATLPSATAPSRTTAASAATATALNNAGATAATGSVARPSGGDIADQAIRAIGQLSEPAIPGPDATPQQLAQYEKDTKRYDRMMELMSTIIKKRDELQMSIVRKL